MLTIQEPGERKYIVMTAQVTLPGLARRGQYKRVAVVLIDTAELPEGRDIPTMISLRARGVKKIVRTWEKLSARGKHTRFAAALEEAKLLADILNRQGELFVAEGGSN